MLKEAESQKVESDDDDELFDVSGSEEE